MSVHNGSANLPCLGLDWSLDSLALSIANTSSASVTGDPPDLKTSSSMSPWLPRYFLASSVPVNINDNSKEDQLCTSFKFSLQTERSLDNVSFSIADRIG